MMRLLLKLPHDKALHFIVGVLIYAIAHFISPVVGMAAVVVAAVGKEVYDWFHRDRHTPDVWDAVVTVIGGVVGLICGL
jgi:predicted PurR-regulated permease PerM